MDGETDDRAAEGPARRWGPMGSDTDDDRAGIARAAINTIRGTLGLDVIGGLRFEHSQAVAMRIE